MTAVRGSNVRNMTRGSTVATWAQHRKHLEVAPMPDAELLLFARNLRARAQEVLAQAEIMRDADARQTMREIAASYERLAERLEKEAGG
jgi:hypothetical protein